jgi:hypothetical protein
MTLPFQQDSDIPGDRPDFALTIPLPLVRSPMASHRALPQGHRGEARSSGDVRIDVQPHSLKGEPVRTRDRQDLGEGRDDVLKLSSAETRVEGKREQPVRRRLRHRADASPEPEVVPVIRVQVEGTEVNTQSDVLCLNGRHNLIPGPAKLLHLHPDVIEVAG